MHLGKGPGALLPVLGVYAQGMHMCGCSYQGGEPERMTEPRAGSSRAGVSGGISRVHTLTPGCQPAALVHTYTQTQTGRHTRTPCCLPHVHGHSHPLLVPSTAGRPLATRSYTHLLRGSEDTRAHTDPHAQELGCCIHPSVSSGGTVTVTQKPALHRKTATDSGEQSCEHTCVLTPHPLQPEAPSSLLVWGFPFFSRSLPLPPEPGPREALLPFWTPLCLGKACTG